MATTFVDIQDIIQFRSSFESYGSEISSTLESFRQEYLAFLSSFNTKLRQLERERERAGAALSRCHSRQSSSEHPVSCASEEAAFERACARCHRCESLIAQAQAAIDEFELKSSDYSSKKDDLVSRAIRGLDRVENMINEYSSDSGPATSRGSGPNAFAPDIALGTMIPPVDSLQESAIHIAGGEQIASVLPKGSGTDPIRIDPEAMAHKLDNLPSVVQPDSFSIRIAAIGIVSALGVAGAGIGLKELLTQKYADEIFEAQYGISRTELLLASGPKQQEYIEAYNNIGKQIQAEVSQIKTRPEIKDSFDESLSRMESDDLRYMKLVYGDYCELAEIADYSYHEHQLPAEMGRNGWQDVSLENPIVNRICYDAEMKSIEDSSGLKISVLRKGDRYVVAFGGTDFPDRWDNIHQVKEFYKDARTDVQGMFSPEEQQVQRAREAVRRLVKEGNIPLDRIEFTGHSLGGRIAAEMSVSYARPATTFNAAGVSEQTRQQYEYLLAHSKTGYTGVRNVVTEHDFLTNMQELGSGSSNPYIAALPKGEIRIAHETVSGTLSSSEGKVVKKVLDSAGPLGSATGKVIDGVDKTLNYADKFNTYYNRDYRALGGTLVLPDKMSGISGEAHKLTTVKDSLYARYNSVNNWMEVHRNQ